MINDGSLRILELEECTRDVDGEIVPELEPDAGLDRAGWLPGGAACRGWRGLPVPGHGPNFRPVLKNVARDGQVTADVDASIKAVRDQKLGLAAGVRGVEPV